MLADSRVSLIISFYEVLNIPFHPFPAIAGGTLYAAGSKEDTVWNILVHAQSTPTPLKRQDESGRERNTAWLLEGSAVLLGFVVVWFGRSR